MLVCPFAFNDVLLKLKLFPPLPEFVGAPTNMPEPAKLSGNEGSVLPLDVELTAPNQ